MLVALAGFGVWYFMPGGEDAASAVYFTDELTGPDSAHFTIPFQAYAMTPKGLLRSSAVTRRGFGSDRVVVKTVSGDYLSRDFVFEIDVMIPPDAEDLAYVGFGRGDPNPAYNNEPAGAFQFRIHSLPWVNRVDASASLPSSDQPAEAGPKVHAELTPIGQYVAGSTTTFRIERAGTKVTLSMPGTPGAAHTFDMTLVPTLFGDGEGFLFFGNSVEGTVFSRARVRPRG